MNARLAEAAVPSGFLRIPGLFRRAELEPLDQLEPGYHLVGAGCAPDGGDLVAVYRRDPAVARDVFKERAPVSVEVVLPEMPGLERTVVRYCDVCSRWGGRHSVHLCGTNWYPKLETLLSGLAPEGRAAR
jgi:hypothetical protein